MTRMLCGGVVSVCKVRAGADTQVRSPKNRSGVLKVFFSFELVYEDDSMSFSLDNRQHFNFGQPRFIFFVCPKSMAI